MNRSDDLFSQPSGTPDPYWQRAFEDAADTPPPRVWEGVERQLDLDESDGILPLWQHRQGRQSMLFGRWAAGIAASLLLTVLGWWAWHREDAIRPDVSVAVAPAPSRIASGTSLAPVGPTVAMAEAETTNGQSPLPRSASESTVARRQAQTGRLADAGPSKPGTSMPGIDMSGTSTPDASALDVSLNAGTLAITDKPAGQTDKAAENSFKQAFNPSSIRAGVEEPHGTVVYTETTMSSMSMRIRGTELPQSVAIGRQPAAGNRSMMTQSFTMQSITIQSQSGQLPPVNSLPTTLASVPALEQSGTLAVGDLQERVALAVDPLSTKPLVIRPLGNDRIVWYNNETLASEPAAVTSKKQTQRPWLSAGVTASAFNPTVAVRSSFSPAASSPITSVAGSASPATVSSLQNQVGRAVAFQAGIGIPLGEHWSVETGVGYLNGQNQVQSPARVASLTSAIVSAASDNLYVDLVARLANNSSWATYSLGANQAQADAFLNNQKTSYSSNQQQAVSNTYQFMQVPVQVGYELRPRRKFGLALLTGMVSNWFVRNTVAESITIKAGDGVFRPVTLAGTAGMRLRYRPDNHWSASVAGTFQQSLQSLTRTDVSLQAQPQQVGLSFSVDRHF